MGQYHLFTTGVGKTQTTQGEYGVINSLYYLPFSFSPCYNSQIKFVSAIYLEAINRGKARMGGMEEYFNSYTCLSTFL